MYAVSSAVQVAIFTGPNLYILLTHIKETLEDASRPSALECHHHSLAKWLEDQDGLLGQLLNLGIWMGNIKTAWMQVALSRQTINLNLDSWTSDNVQFHQQSSFFKQIWQ